MKSKIEVGDLFYYDGSIGKLVGKITEIRKSSFSENKRYSYSRIWGTKEDENQMFFYEKSGQCALCKFGKTLDELWVRMI
ncbi:MAG: hypothetical protein IMZ52_01605 [Actinobacteria bacterium]|nr:hypothetical protein [Actinomycetota bacterium]MBE3114822.1 hypothetical protein [Actinomycetota bacterium]